MAESQTARRDLWLLAFSPWRSKYSVSGSGEFLAGENRPVPIFPFAVPPPAFCRCSDRGGLAFSLCLVFDLFAAADRFDVAGHQHLRLTRIRAGEVRGGVPDHMVEQVFINRIRLVELGAEHFV
jgi:hypothetical protein